MTAAEAAALRGHAAALGVRIDAAAEDRLGRFLALLAEWNQHVRLTGERDPQRLLERHVVDCLALVPHLPAAGGIADLGSGAGFPGLIIACVRPDLDVVLVDARRRPVSFLRDAVRTLGLPRVTAVEGRAEDVGRRAEFAHRFALVTSRAIRLDVFLRLAPPFLAPGGIVIAMQTPRTPAAAAGARLVPTGTRDYALPSGERRRLLLFAATC